MDKLVSDLIKRGEVGILPTDTIYGIVGSALNKKTVERIYKVRRRTPSKPLIILIGSFSDLTTLGIKNPPLKILKTLWPAKITVILPVVSKKFEYLHRGTNTLAFRMPDSKSLLALLKKTGPIVAPSANPEGKSPAETVEEAAGYFGINADFYVDDGKMKGEPSTIVEIDKKGKISLVREGAVKSSGKKLKGLLQ
ncbi:MAG: L-threonylcarbamoyladenylate synthase [Candidatus Paceibacterota bacterium]|jgi:L-threonylcarbamoyladenylate synthase